MTDTAGDYTAKDNILKKSTITAVSPPSIDNVQGFDGASDPDRVSQQQIIPGFVRTRALGNIIDSSVSGLGNALFGKGIVPNGFSGVFNLTVASSLNQVILAVPDVSFYIGSVAAANQWPTAAVGGGNFPIYVTTNDFGQTNNVDVVTRVVCRNNSGADQTVIVAVRWRIIANAAMQQSPSGATTS